MPSRISAILCVLLYVATPLFSFTEAELDAPLPLDKNVRIGKLDNGFRYLIRENKKPEGRALLRLVIDVGSLQEEDDEKGIAHFIEHMAFNGTKNFEKHEIIDFLEGVGMRFGSHLNASTSFNETIYKLEIPLDDPETIEKGFLILEDWASNILFEPEEIDKERGIVIEEWRARKGVGQRLQEKQRPLLYHGSKYIDRLPIGEVPIIESLTPEQFQNFYRKWYRPELMSLVAVGDFSTDEIEAKIKQHFSHLENPSHAPARVDHPLADHEETLFSIETDPELSQSSIGVLLKTDGPEYGTVRVYRERLVENLYFALINNRLRERTKLEDPPFLGAGIGRGSLGREKGYYRMSAGLIDADYSGGLKGLLQEVERASRDGFAPTEFERMKVNILRSLEKAYAERDKQQSSRYLREYISHFLVGESVPGLEYELELVRQILADLQLSEINAKAAALLQTTNRVILFTAPEKEDYVKPTEDQILAALTLKVEDSLSAYDDGISDAPLLPQQPEAGTILSETYIESIDTYDLKLSNGIRVIAKSTDFKNDQILINGYSPGGHSLIPDEHFVSATFASDIVSRSGMGDYDSIELGKKLAGKIVSSGTGLSSLYENVRGSSSPKDLETYFQLMHLNLTQPRLDMGAFASMKKRLLASVENRLKSPNAHFSDAISQALYGDHPRHRALSIEVVNEIDPHLAFELYKQRFSDLGDLHLVIVGSFELDILKEHLKRYVASLPTGGRSEIGRFAGDHKTTGQQNVVVPKNAEQKTVVSVMYHGPAEWSPENAMALGIAKDVLSIRLREKLREDESKVYGSRVSASLSRFPIQRFSSGFSFTCAPENADDLIAMTRAEIETLQTNGPLEEDLEKIRQQQLRSYEKNLKQNGYWVSSFLRYLKQDRPLDTMLEFPERIQSFDGKEAQRAAQLYFDNTNQLIAKLDPLPSETESEPEE
ncbi:M16 family metallopeptidase [Pelagicoccus mobilis]|uniref:Insulinase family protein n=1 Tax=Pelagicoccus mobilis TaxID=415221 RepID=A0A934VPS0_9BACT|nr:insulinase family protein [Pelagicoccus mobilis]MBK1877582.1 insulinase family protein [Pelagicoccus mobilis]